MSTPTLSITNDEAQPRVVKRQNAALSIILIAIFVAVFVVGIVLLIVFIVAPQGNQIINKPNLASSGIPITVGFHDMRLLPRAVQNIPPGGTCVDQAQCVPGTFCNASGLCQVGTGKMVNQVCVSNDECGVGNYCGGGNVCQPGVGWTTGGPCTNKNNCALGFQCANKVCNGVPLPAIPDPFTTVPVFRISTKISGLHITDLLNPKADATLYNSGNPVWFGCGETGTDRVPVYLWYNPSLEDYVFSRSNASPFKTGTSGYVIQNAGNPAFYLFTIQYDRTVPVYVLEGFQLLTARKYHIGVPNFTLLPPDQFLGNSMIYELNSNATDPSSLLGYAFIQE